MRIPAALVAATAVFAGVSFTSAQTPRTDAFVESRDHAAIQYTRGETTDRIARLSAELADGRVTLASEPGTGYLRSLLDRLNIGIDSQVVVYSQTSAQATHINPRNPRALYFDDSVAVGY